MHTETTLRNGTAHPEAARPPGRHIAHPTDTPPQRPDQYFPFLRTTRTVACVAWRMKT